MILILILSVIFNWSSCFSVDESEPNEQAKVELIASQLQLEHNPAWPTFEWDKAPLLITFENGHIYAFQLNSQDSHWEHREVKGYSVLYSEEDYWGVSELHMEPQFFIEGQVAFLYRMRSDAPPLEDVAVFTHERFHRHQHEVFFHGRGSKEFLDHLNLDNLTWAEMEDEILRDFLRAEPSQKMEILKDFIVANSWRRNLIAPESRLWEDDQLRMEGLADYTSTRMWGGEELLLKMHPPKEIEEGFIDDAIKWRHYLAGAFIGYALDFLAVPEWKAQVEEGEPLPKMLHAAVPLSPEERKERLGQVKLRLNYKKRRKKIALRIDQYQRDLEQLYRDYESQEGVRLVLERPATSISGGGSNEQMFYLPDGSTVGLKDESVSATTDGKWKFATHHVSHLFHRRGGLREVKISESSTLTIDRVSLPFNPSKGEPKEYPFRSLVIEGKEISFSSEGHQGVLVCNGRDWRVAYLD